MPIELEKWMSEIGAEVKLRANTAPLSARTRHIDDLLRMIAERELALGTKAGDKPR
jgi:hypothetical protein